MTSFDATEWITMFQNDYEIIHLNTFDVENIKSIINIRFLTTSGEKSPLLQEMIDDLCDRYNKRIEKYISRYESGVFCKMTMKSGKNDSNTISQPKFTTRQIFDELTNSLEIKSFLEMFPNQGILLSPFKKDIQQFPENEYRIFVENSCIKIISNFVSDFSLKNFPMKKIQEMIQQVSFPKFSADIFIQNKEIVIIEINPWDERTGIGKFKLEQIYL